MKKVNQLLVGLAVAAAATLASQVRADTYQISDVEGVTSGTVVTIDNSVSGQYPVVTAILSAPGTVNGRAYSSYSFLVNDGTGSLDIYGTLSGLGYTPTVGDAISATGTYAPYHQIPEVGTLTAITLQSQNNLVPDPLIKTIPDVVAATIPESIAGYLITLKGVTISGLTGTFGTGNLQGNITDSNNNSMEFYYWPTSYSVANANLYGQPIPTGPVDVTGFISESGGTFPAEFSPISITASATPEPASLALLGIGGLALLARRRK